MFIFLWNLSIKAQEDVQYIIKNTTPSKDGRTEANMDVIYTEEELIFLDDLTDTIKFQSFESYSPKIKK